MKVIDDDDDASLLPKIGADGFPLRGVTRARDYMQEWTYAQPFLNHMSARGGRSAMDTILQLLQNATLENYKEN